MGLEVALYKIYVDDIFKALRESNPGWYYSRELDRMTYDPLHPN